MIDGLGDVLRLKFGNDLYVPWHKRNWGSLLIYKIIFQVNRFYPPTVKKIKLLNAVKP